METESRWSKTLVVIGAVLFGLGTLDPMEGSVAILAGTGLVLLGTYLGRQPKPMLAYWMWVFGLVAVGVAALWGLSALGGVGGKTERSMGWLLLCVPYPVGWLMALGGLVDRAGRAIRGKQATKLPVGA